MGHWPPKIRPYGSLPVGCGLSTMYTAAVTTQARNPQEAQALINLLISADARGLRERAGFLSGAS